jgi:putative sigma-54 modulation protein
LQDKADKLPRFYDRIHRFDVVLDHQADQFVVEMIVHADRKQTFVVSGEGPDTFVLVDSLIDNLERQLVRHKGKMRKHKHDGKPDLTLDETPDLTLED